MNHSETSTTPSSTASPVSGHWLGTVLVRVVIPLWVVTGGLVKLVTFDPSLLPGPILDLVRASGRMMSLQDPTAWLEASLRFFVAVEIAAAIVMVLAPRLARFTASFILSVFLAVLVATMAQSASRDGISAIWSSSCGCFGSASPPPIGMFAIDLLLLLGVIFIRPRRTGLESWRIWVPITAVLVGSVIAFGRPRPVLQIQIDDVEAIDATETPTTEQPVDVAEEDRPDWSMIPTEVASFFAPDFPTWVDSPLVEQPMMRLLSRPVPTWIETGRFHLVLHRADCEHCHELLETHFTGELETPVLAVEVPDTDPDLALPMPCEACRLHRLPEGPTYVFATPVLMTIENGRVLAVCEDAQDAALVLRTLQARLDG